MPHYFVPMSPIDMELTGVFHASLTEQGRAALCDNIGVKLAAVDDSDNVAVVIWGQGESGYAPEDEPVISKAMGAVMTHLTGTFHLDTEGKGVIRGPRSWEDNGPEGNALLERLKAAMGVELTDEDGATK